MGYCTKTDVLNLMDRADTTDPTVLENVDMASSTATRVIDGYTHRKFAKVTGTRSFPSPRDGRALYLPDISAVTAVKLDDLNDGTFATTLDTADYELDTPYRSQVTVIDGDADTANWPWEELRLLTRAWPYGTRRVQVQVTGDWGWLAVPDDIKQASAMLAVRFSQRMQQAAFGVQSWGELGAAAIRSSDPDVAMILDDYRKVSVA